MFKNTNKLTQDLQEYFTLQEQLIDELCRYIDNSDPSRRVFAVDGTETALTKDLKKLVGIVQVFETWVLSNKGDLRSWSLHGVLDLFPKSFWIFKNDYYKIKIQLQLELLEYYFTVLTYEKKKVVQTGVIFLCIIKI